MTLPARFGRYTIERPLGKGGMGAVYLAQDELRRRVVVKVINPEFASDAVAVERLRREAVAAAKVSSPHVVRVHEFGVEGGTPFIAMEYVEGRSVQQIVAELGKFPPEQATRLVLAAAQGLREVHAAGILHRDIKPANILMDGEGRVKLADFGICKISKKTLEGTPTISLAGEVLGSPDYMAPEQAEGKPLDPRADVYALGVTYYQLLTGTLPFHATTAIATLARALNDKAATPRSIATEIPPSVERVCLRMMARDRALRPKDADAVIALIKGIGRPSERIARTSSERQIPKAAVATARRRSPVPMLLASALLVGGVGGLVVARATQAEPPREAATQRPAFESRVEPAAASTESATPTGFADRARGKDPETSVEPPEATPIASETVAAAPAPPEPEVKKAEPVPVAVVETPHGPSPDELAAFDAERTRAHTDLRAALRVKDAPIARTAAERLRKALPRNADREREAQVAEVEALASSLDAVARVFARLGKTPSTHNPGDIFQILLDSARKEDDVKLGATALAAWEKAPLPDPLAAEDARAKSILGALELAFPKIDRSWSTAQAELAKENEKPLIKRSGKVLAKIKETYPRTTAGKEADLDAKALKIFFDVQKRLRDAIEHRSTERMKEAFEPIAKIDKHLPADFAKDLKAEVELLDQIYKLMVSLAYRADDFAHDTVDDMEIKLHPITPQDATAGESIAIVAAVDKVPMSSHIMSIVDDNAAPGPLLEALGVERPETTDNLPKPSKLRPGAKPPR